MIKIEISTSSYNERRYGKPYLARMDFATDPKGAPQWGSWIGHPGEEGILMIDAAPGDVIMQGQRDGRKARNSAPDYGLVLADGSIQWLPSKAAAYRASREYHTTTETAD